MILCYFFYLIIISVIGSFGVTCQITWTLQRLQKITKIYKIYKKSSDLPVLTINRLGKNCYFAQTMSEIGCWLSPIHSRFFSGSRDLLHENQLGF